MKKIITTILGFLLLFSLTSCGNPTVSYTDKNGNSVEVKLEETKDQETCKKAVGYILASDYLATTIEADLNAKVSLKDSNLSNTKDVSTNEITINGSLKKDSTYLDALGEMNAITNTYDAVTDKVQTENVTTSVNIDLDMEEKMGYYAISLPGFSYKIKGDISEQLDEIGNNTTTPDSTLKDPIELLDEYNGILEIVKVSNKSFTIQIILSPKDIEASNASGPLAKFENITFNVTAETKTGCITSINSNYKSSATYKDEYSKNEHLAEVEFKLEFNINYPKDVRITKLTDAEKGAYLDTTIPPFGL